MTSTTTHKAEPRSTTEMDRRRVAVGLGHYVCKCGRSIIEVEDPAVDGFGDDAFFWRHLPRKAAR